MGSPRVTLTFAGAVPLTPIILPLAGSRVSAGFTNPADDFREDPLNLTAMLTPHPHTCFLWWAEGTLAEVGIFKGDLLVVDRGADLEDGCTVVAVIEGESTLKVYRCGPPPYLECAAANFPLLIVAAGEDISVWGRVTFNVHRPNKRR